MSLILPNCSHCHCDCAFMFFILTDIHEGNLKSILTLFFNVSRYKQALKQSSAQCTPLNDLYGNKCTFGFASAAPPSATYSGFRSPPAVPTHPLMPYARPFDLSGYLSDPGTQGTVRVGKLIPPPLPPAALGQHSPAASRPLGDHVPPCGSFPSADSSASSIVSLLSTASLPVGNSNHSNQLTSNASTTPSTNMISR